MFSVASISQIHSYCPGKRMMSTNRAGVSKYIAIAPLDVHMHVAGGRAKEAPFALHQSFRAY